MILKYDNKKSVNVRWRDCKCKNQNILCNLKCHETNAFVIINK